MNTKIFIAIGTIALIFFLTKRGSGSGIDKRQALFDWNGSVVFQQMSESEINSSYDYVFNYVSKGVRPETGSTLYNAITLISSKYNIFS